MNHPNVAADLFNSSTLSNQRDNDYRFDDYRKELAEPVAAADHLVPIELISSCDLGGYAYPAAAE
jgi:hypothetical protein